MAKQKAASPSDPTKTPMPEQKPVIITSTKTSTRVHAGIALVTIGGVALAAFGFFWFNLLRLNNETAAPAKKQQVTANTESKAEKVGKLTRQLFASGATVTSQTTSAADRKTALIGLAKEDPAAAQNQVLSAAAIEALPESIQASVEKEVTVTGELEVIVGEDLDTKTSHYELALLQGEKRSALFAPDPGSYVSLAGKSVHVRGFQIDDQNILLSADGETGSVTTDSTTETTTTAAATTKDVVIILFNFVNDTRQPIAIDDARGRIFGLSNSVSNFDKEGSYNAVSLKGKVRIDGDVLGYFTLPSTYNSSTQTCGNYYRTWSDAARQLATAAGNDLTGYSHYIYIFPRPASACPGWSWAEIVGDENWINDFKIPTLAHEHGHNLGAPHSSAYICRDASGVPTTLSTSCTIDEYGDPFDIMGGGPTGSYFHYGNAHKSEIGWLPPANIQTVTASGTYMIYPIEKPTTNTQAILVGRNKNSSGQISENLWLEYRQPYGFDTFTSSDPVANGVILRLAPVPGGGTYLPGNLSWNTLLLDTNPATSTFSDAPLAVGQTFFDGAYGIQVETVAATSEYATVTVTLSGPVCTKAAPTVALTAAAGTYGSSGQPLNYYVNVTNKDSSACASSTFTITPTIPTGWTQTPSSISFTLAPGATRQTVVTITSNATASAAVYPVTQLVTNTTTNQSVTVASTYTVTGPDVTAPKVTISSPSNGETLRGNKAVKINASAADASGITAIEILLDGVSKVTCPNVSSCSYTAPSLASGTHTILVRATDKSANANIGTAAITVTKK